MVTKESVGPLAKVIVPYLFLTATEMEDVLEGFNIETCQILKLRDSSYKSQKNKIFILNQCEDISCEYLYLRS